MAKNDMPGMKGNATPANKFAGMWGPVGGGNAPGGNSMPWMTPPITGGQGGGFNPILQALQQRLGNAGNQGNAGGNGMGEQMRTLPMMPRMMEPNPNGMAVPEMAAASSIGPSQPQELIANLIKQSAQPMPMMAPMTGGNIPPSAQNFMGQNSGIQAPVESSGGESALQSSIAPRKLFGRTIGGQ